MRARVAHQVELSPTPKRLHFMGDTGQVIANMQGRIEQCRRIAKSITDPSMIASLLKMAQEIEADIQRLEAEQMPT